MSLEELKPPSLAPVFVSRLDGGEAWTKRTRWYRATRDLRAVSGGGREDRSRGDRDRR